MRTCMHVCIWECITCLHARTHTLCTHAMCAQGVCSCMQARLRCQCMYMKFVCVCACVHEVYIHPCMCLHVSQSMRGASWVMTRRHGRAGRLARKTSTYWHEGGMMSSTTVFS